MLGGGGEGGEGTCDIYIQGYACHVLGFQISLENNFLSKIWNMNFPFLWVKFSVTTNYLGSVL